MNYLLCTLMEIPWLPKILAVIITSGIAFCIIISLLVLTVIALVLIERKLLGFFTQRKGPNRVGLWGVLQTTADAIKLLCKENIELKHSDKILFTLAPIMAFASVIVLWCLIPYNSEFHLINSSVGILLYFFFASFPMIFHFLAGYSSNNKYSILGAYRGLALTASYSVSIIFSVLSIILITGTMDLDKIVLYQSHKWIIFSNVLGFIVFFITSLAKLNRCPFDLSEAESEIICGYHTEYSGMRFAMFFLGEYAELFVMSMLIVVLFFGGYLSPFGGYISNTFMGNCPISSYLIYFEQTIWLFIKTLIVIFSIIWIRATLPRLTQFSTLNLFWKYIIPVSMINLIIIFLVRF